LSRNDKHRNQCCVSQLRGNHIVIVTDY